MFNKFFVIQKLITNYVEYFTSCDVFVEKKEKTIGWKHNIFYFKIAKIVIIWIIKIHTKIFLASVPTAHTFFLSEDTKYNFVLQQ